jgi:hypothetical protein
MAQTKEQMFEKRPDLIVELLNARNYGKQGEGQGSPLCWLIGLVTPCQRVQSATMGPRPITSMFIFDFPNFFK